VLCSNGPVQAQVEELPENRVRLTVQVPSDDVHHAVEHAASDLAQTAKIPGFRKGKVPRQLLVQRIGKERLMAEAIESHIGGWFWNAAARSRVRPVAQPEYEFELPQTDDDDWEFTATVRVQEKPELADWSALEVGAFEADVPEELVERELDALRATVAELVPVDGRPVGAEDTVVVDLVSPSGEERRDYVVELGRGSVVDEIEAGVVGMQAGETKEIGLERPGEPETAAVQVTMKEIKEKVLPPLDDDLARSASEFDTLDELRSDVEQRLREQLDAEADEAFRRATLDRLVEASNVRVDGPVVDARTRTLLRELDAVMRRSGGTLDAYLQLSGESAEALVARLREQAAASVAGEMLLEAAADELGVTVGDEEVDQSFRDRFEEGDKIIEQAKEAGAYESEREAMRLARTLDRIAAEVERIAPEQAAAREAIWTPDKEKPKTETKLWTPGSKETA
jgi:trigger factor